MRFIQPFLIQYTVFNENDEVFAPQDHLDFPSTIEHTAGKMVPLFPAI